MQARDESGKIEGTVAREHDSWRAAFRVRIKAFHAPDEKNQAFK